MICLQLCAGVKVKTVAPVAHKELIRINTRLCMLGSVIYLNACAYEQTVEKICTRCTQTCVHRGVFVGQAVVRGAAHLRSLRGGLMTQGAEGGMGGGCGGLAGSELSRAEPN